MTYFIALNPHSAIAFPQLISLNLTTLAFAVCRMPTHHRAKNTVPARSGLRVLSLTLYRRCSDRPPVRPATLLQVP